MIVKVTLAIFERASAQHDAHTQGAHIGEHRSLKVSTTGVVRGVRVCVWSVPEGVRGVGVGPKDEADPRARLTDTTCVHAI